MSRARIECGLQFGVLGIALSFAANALAAPTATTLAPVTNATVAERAFKIAVTRPAVATATARAPATATAKPASAPLAAEVKISAPVAGHVKVDNTDASQEKPRLSLSSNATTVSVKPGQQLVVHAEDSLLPAPPVPLSATVKAPLASTVLIGTQDADNRPNVRQFQPFVMAEVSPMRWDARGLAYETTLLVGLDPVAGDPGADLKLDPPIAFQVTGENLDHIEPARIAVAVAGPSGYQRVVLSTTRFDAPVKVSAHSIAGNGTFSASIEPGPIRFALGSAASGIEGLGLGQTTISARRLAANGELLPGAGPASVELTTSSGSLQPGTIELAEKASDGRTVLVSAGWGDATIAQTNSPNSITVSFLFPWLKLLLSVAGAAAAGVLQVLTGKSKKRAWLAGVLGAVLSGLALTILVALGAPFAPEWLRTALGSELAWFAVGVVSGYPGPKTLDWLSQKIFGMKDEEKPEPQPQN